MLIHSPSKNRVAVWEGLKKALQANQTRAIGVSNFNQAQIEDLAKATGVCLDPVYSGKAALGMCADLKERPCERALFIHTGGLLGLYEKAAQLKPLLG